MRLPDIMPGEDKDASIFCRFAGSIWDEVRQNKCGNTSNETVHSGFSMKSSESGDATDTGWTLFILFITIKW